jgi:hypothetical protein
VVIAAACAVFVVAALAIPRYVSRSVVPTDANTQPEVPAPPVQVAGAQPDAQPALPPLPVTVVADPEVPKPVIEKPRQLHASSTKKNARALPPASESQTSRAEASAARAVIPAPATSVPAAQSNPSESVSQTAAVTITGCLESTIDGHQYRLTDTEGADAPKARSWRSGFLNKRSAPVELVEFSELSDLRKYVGHRVAATGVLTSRELHVHSLESAGPSCN